jgi:hypothetical protein
MEQRGAPLSEKNGQLAREDDELIETLRSTITDRGLITPAILFLELLKPLSFFGSQVLLLVEPLLGASMRDSSQRYSRLFQDRRNVEQLIIALENQRNRTL